MLGKEKRNHKRERKGKRRGGRGKKHKSRTRSLERKSKGRRQASRPQDIAEGGRPQAESAAEAKALAFAVAERPTANFKMQFLVFRSFRWFEHAKNHFEFSEQSYVFFIFFRNLFFPL
jgi:hypothetical protein